MCVLDEVRTGPTCRRLTTLPGVGPLTALAFRTTIGSRARSEGPSISVSRGLIARRLQGALYDRTGPAHGDAASCRARLFGRGGGQGPKP
jgi:transposase